MTVIPIMGDEHWHSLRAKHIGGSEVGALFDASHWTTMFSLYHRKAGNAPEREFINDRAEWGKRLEPAIAEGVAADMRWNMVRSKEYHSRDDIRGMGATLDYDIIDHSAGPGIAEIKFVAEYRTWKEDWTDARGPVPYELQLQHQLACCPLATWGVLICFIGQTATPVIYERKPQPKVIAEIERRVTNFWTSIDKKEAPDPAGTSEEWAMLRELYPAIERDKVITIADSRLSDVASLYDYGQAQQRGGKQTFDTNKVKLLAALGDADLMIIPGWHVRQRPHGKGRVVTVEERDTGIAHDPMFTTPVELA